MPFGLAQYTGQAGFQVLRRQALEARAGKALQTADHEGHDYRGSHLGIDRGRGGAAGGGCVAQALLEAGLELVEELVHALLQDRKSTRLNSSHIQKSRMPSSA